MKHAQLVWLRCVISKWRITVAQWHEARGWLEQALVMQMRQITRRWQLTAEVRCNACEHMRQAQLMQMKKAKRKWRLTADECCNAHGHMQKAQSMQLKLLMSQWHRSFVQSHQSSISINLAKSRQKQQTFSRWRLSVERTRSVVIEHSSPLLRASRCLRPCISSWRGTLLLRRQACIRLNISSSFRISNFFQMWQRWAVVCARIRGGMANMHRVMLRSWLGVWQRRAVVCARIRGGTANLHRVVLRARLAVWHRWAETRAWISNAIANVHRVVLQGWLVMWQRWVAVRVRIRHVVVSIHRVVLRGWLAMWHHAALRSFATLYKPTWLTSWLPQATVSPHNGLLVEWGPWRESATDVAIDLVFPTMVQTNTHRDCKPTIGCSGGSLSLDHASLHSHNHTLPHSHTLLITCTFCYDLTKGTQDKDFSYSFSDSLSRYFILTPAHTPYHLYLLL